jgi:uncharacterized protein YjbI with pentapeptide repeats
MQIIKPQQLIFLNGRYQIGGQSYLGISAVAGFYLSNPDHFACEADIWAGWEKAPMSFRVLDMAEPKPLAEFLLAGHVQTGQAEKVADASVSVGGLSRQWRLVGESDRTSLQVTPFSRMPLDHTQSYGGEGCEDNPLGRGHQDGLSPMLMTLENGELQRQSPLAAPVPVPQDFAVRKFWLEKVAAEMNGKSYLENVFPGFPQSLDRRYFQLAPPSQRLSQEGWPDDVPYALSGFLPDGEIIQGSIPKVQARAFCSTRAEPEKLMPLQLTRKTLWLLPDSDLGLVIFTGQLAISHLMDQPLASLTLALDGLNAPRDDVWFHEVITRRRASSGSEFDSLYDPDLMPQGAGMNAIHTKAHNPTSPRYKQGVRHDSIEHYRMLRQKVVEHQQKSQIAAPALEKIDWQAFSHTCRHPLATLAGGREPNVIEGEIYTGQAVEKAVLTNLTFRQCQFVDCSLTEAVLSGCLFEYCQFENCTLNGSQFSQCTLSKSRFTQCQFDDVQLVECNLMQVGFNESSVRRLRATACIWQEGQFEKSNFSQSQLVGGEMNSCSFIDSLLSGSHWQAIKVTGCIANQCEWKNGVLEDVDFCRGSLLGCDCRHTVWRRSRLESTTLRDDCRLAMVGFSECLLVQTGFRAVELHNSTFTCTTMSEVSFEGADLRHSRLIRCEMAGCNLKESQLRYSAWQQSSLQGAVLYHADLRDATFDGCNLVTATLSLIRRNTGSRFDRCLLDEAVWYPLWQEQMQEENDA